MLWEKNRAFRSGVNGEGNSTLRTEENVRNKRLQAKMAVELPNVDRDLGNECTRLWDQFGDEFSKPRTWDFKSLDEYREHRIIGAECP